MPASASKRSAHTARSVEVTSTSSEIELYVIWLASFASAVVCTTSSSAVLYQLLYIRCELLQAALGRMMVDATVLLHFSMQ
jgi:hypothetical protein